MGLPIDFVQRLSMRAEGFSELCAYDFWKVYGFDFESVGLCRADIGKCLNGSAIRVAFNPDTMEGILISCDANGVLWFQHFRDRIVNVDILKSGRVCSGRLKELVDRI